MEEEEKEVLARLVEEFPAALQDGEPLPASPLSRRLVTMEELQGESLELGRRLLATRGAPAGLGALLCREALTRLLQDDLSPFHCQQEEQDATEEEEEEQPVVLLQSEAVQRLFLNKLLEVARAWHQKAPPTPPTSPLSPPRCSVYAIKNTRRKMEDKHVVLPEFNQLLGLQDGVERAYYAVFDGHGGVDAATYAAAHLHVALSQQEALQSDAATAFKHAFRRTDGMFRGKARRERLRSGSTGVAVLLQGSEVTVSWLGDSQALLVRNGEVVTLMEPHKPEREDEKQRIEDLGGCITFMGCWRVNGTYAVSRAIGDFDQKPYVSGEADSASLRLHGDEDYLLLACDGFFDAVKPTEVPQLVLDALRGPGGGGGEADEGVGGGGEGEKEEEEKEAFPGERVAQRLVFHAKAAGSSDNITVMVAFLQPPQLLLSRDCNSQHATLQQ